MPGIIVQLNYVRIIGQFFDCSKLNEILLSKKALISVKKLAYLFNFSPSMFVKYHPKFHFKTMHLRVCGLIKSVERWALSAHNRNRTCLIIPFSLDTIEDLIGEILYTH